MTAASRRAGQHARSTTARLARRGLIWLVLPLLAGAVVGAALGFTSAPFIAPELLALAGVAAVAKWWVPRVERYDRGATGEERVGDVLASLEGEGWRALHDVEFERGNIDHVVVGPGGLFTIETKSHAGRMDAERCEERWLKQAYRHAKRLERVSGLPVVPLLVFSRAYVVPAIETRRGVTILPARMLGGHLARRGTALSAEEVAELHARLAAAFA